MTRYCTHRAKQQISLSGGSRSAPKRDRERERGRERGREKRERERETDRQTELRRARRLAGESSEWMRRRRPGFSAASQSLRRTTRRNPKHHNARARKAAVKTQAQHDNRTSTCNTDADIKDRTNSELSRLFIILKILCLMTKLLSLRNRYPMTNFALHG